MEKKLNQLKSEMLKGELAGMDFNIEMKRNVLRKMKKRQSWIQLGRLVPIGISLAVMAAFFVGIGYLLKSDFTKGPAENPPIETKMPELVAPTFVPEPYVFKHTKNSDDVVKHVYVNPADEEEQFSYRMQKSGVGIEIAEPIQLAAVLKGYYMTKGEYHTAIWWEAEGYYQVVEQSGPMARVDLLKITDSILKEKGYESLLSDEIAKFEGDPPQEQNAGELSREAAEEMLLKYENTLKTLERDPNTLKFKDISTKEEFYAQFTEYMTLDGAVALMDYLVKEKDDGLYMVATEYQPFFVKDVPYDLMMINNREYGLTQEQNDELDGRASFNVSFIEEDGKWKINNIRKHYYDQEN